MLKLMGKRRPIKYSSLPTRFTSLQFTMGGAEFNEKMGMGTKLPIDNGENLEHKFNSGVCRTDIPSQWGCASVDRRLAGRVLSVADDARDWQRNKGERK